MKDNYQMVLSRFYKSLLIYCLYINTFFLSLSFELNQKLTCKIHLSVTSTTVHASTKKNTFPGF